MTDTPVVVVSGYLGAGKTTFINLITGRLTPSAGNILLGGAGNDIIQGRGGDGQFGGQAQGAKHRGHGRCVDE